MDDPMLVSERSTIPLEAVQIRTSRSSGPGGQHANVTASRVDVEVDLTTCPGLADDDRRLLLERLGPRVTATAQDTRSQLRNRELALQRLQRRLAAGLVTAPPRRPTRPTRGSVADRLASKRRRADLKRDRRPPDAES
jgi:ribosome-associated protein